MLHGEYIRGDGLVIPNSITTLGSAQFLRAIAQNEAFTMFMGLANCVPDVGLLVVDCGEPTIGTNGYARQELTRDGVDWPTEDVTDGINYIESKDVVFAASVGDFDLPISRLMLVSASTAGNILSLGGAMDSITIGTATDIALRTFRYRIYLR